MIISLSADKASKQRAQFSKPARKTDVKSTRANPEAIKQYTQHLKAAKADLKLIESLIKKYTKEIKVRTKDVEKNPDHPKLALKKSNLKDAKADLRKANTRKKAQEKLIIHYQKKIQKAEGLKSTSASSSTINYKGMNFDFEDIRNGIFPAVAATIDLLGEASDVEQNDQGYRMPPKTEQAWKAFQRWAKQGAAIEQALMTAYKTELAE